ncbi:hypothetical protein ACSSZE_07755 [Acidithiobacillus caldus]
MKEAKMPPHRWFEEHPDIETLDRWRAGLLSEPVAQAVRAHVDGCSQCRRSVAFAPQLVLAWAGFEPAIRVRPSRRDRRLHTAAWFRGVLAGLVVAAVLIGAQLSIFRPSGGSEALSAIQGPPQREVVGHLGFYEWLADHPERMQQVEHGF